MLSVCWVTCVYVCACVCVCFFFLSCSCLSAPVQVRVQCFSGTHAIACALFGVLRPGDTMLACSGRPYDTLDEVIGTRTPMNVSLLWRRAVREGYLRA